MLSVCPVSKRPIVFGYAANQLRYCCVPIFIATGVCRVLCMHWVSRVTVTIVSVAAVQWVFLAFAQGVLSGVSPRLDTRTFCHTWLPHRGIVMGDSDFDRFKRVMGGYKHDGSKGKSSISY